MNRQEMKEINSQYVPVMTSSAGLCLTPANWQEAGVNTAAYNLQTLIFKPGLNFLNELENFKSYMAWPGKIIINASNLPISKDGLRSLVNPYDGSKIHLSTAQLISLILHLKPDAVVLPKQIMDDYPEIWRNWDAAIFPFLYADDLVQQSSNREHGVYFQASDEVLSQVQQWPNVQTYVCGDISLDLMHSLKGISCTYIESNQPAQLATMGKVYSPSALLDLTDNQFSMDFERIVSDCTCPTCTQNLTKAYLHHLILNTPYLAQRFLIQHNIHYVRTYTMLSWARC